jgi:hypothetical protein
MFPASWQEPSLEILAFIACSFLATVRTECLPHPDTAAVCERSDARFQISTRYIEEAALKSRVHAMRAFTENGNSRKHRA